MYADRFTAVIDANVLAPVLKRNILLSLADEGHFRARWSRRILDETEHTIAKLIDSESDARLQAERIKRAFPEGEVLHDEALEEGLKLPDDDDRHVLAAAIACRASVIVTDNLRDFPRDVLSDFEIEAVSADSFIADIVDLYGADAVAALRTMRERFRDPAIDADRLLNLMIARGLKQTAEVLAPFERLL